MSTSLVTMPSQQTALITNDWDTPETRQLILKTVAPGLTEAEAAVFFHVSRSRHLDPLQRQIYAIKRRTWVAEANGGQGAYEERMVLQVGIDGFRSIANRTKLYMPSDKLPLVEGAGGPDLRITVWVRKYHELSQQWMEFGATAYYREFVQVKKNKQSGQMEPVSMWERMPLSQTEKCAEAKALRRGWPEELGGMYTPEEIEREPEVTHQTQTKSAQNKTEKALGTMKPSSEPNRGHGNEGTQRAQPEKTICAECRTTNGHTEDCKNNPKNQPQGQSTKKSAAVDRWNQFEGRSRDSIDFKEGLQLFDLQKNLNLSDEDIKTFLKDKFKIEHRPLIRKDQFQQVLDAIHQQFDPKGDEGSEAPSDGMFSE